MSRDSWLRLLQFGFCVFLLLIALAAPFAMTLGTPDAIKRSLNDSGVYGAVAGMLGEQADPGVQSQIVRQAADDALKPDSVKASVEQTVDDTYRWLDGSSQQQTLRVDLSPAADRLKAAIRQQAERQAASLPYCSAGQLQEIQADPAAFQRLQCLPPGASSASVGDLALAAAVESNMVLKNPVVEIGSLPGGDQSQEALRALGDAPAMYRLMTALPWLFGLGALLLAILTYAIQRQPLRTTYTLARSGLIAGLIVLTVGGLAHALFYVVTKPGSSLTQSAAGTPQEYVFSLAHSLESQLAANALMIGAVYAAIGAIVAVSLKLMERRAALRAIDQAGKGGPQLPTTVVLGTGAMPADSPPSDSSIYPPQR